MSQFWFPSLKRIHDESLDRFIKQFNETQPREIHMTRLQTEQFKYDGTIDFGLKDFWSHVIYFDWERRENWVGASFPYPTLGQFERKFVVAKNIGLTIQIDQTENYIAVAWHHDFNNITDIIRKTENNKVREYGKMRTTGKFKIFQCKELHLFKNWLTDNIQTAPKEMI